MTTVMVARENVEIVSSNCLPHYFSLRVVWSKVKFFVQLYELYIFFPLFFSPPPSVSCSSSSVCRKQ